MNVAVASVLSGAAVAAPSIAAAQCEVDPVFAAIDHHRKLYARYCELNLARDKLWGELRDAAKRTPSVALYPKRDGEWSYVEKTEDHYLMRYDREPATTECYLAASIADIERSATGIPKEHREDWLADRIGEFRRQKRAINRLRSKLGYARLEREETKAEAESYAAGQALIETPPQTVAGVIALIRYALEDSCPNYGGGNLMPDGSDPVRLLDTIATALSGQDVASGPFTLAHGSDGRKYLVRPAPARGPLPDLSSSNLIVETGAQLVC